MGRFLDLLLGARGAFPELGFFGAAQGILPSTPGLSEPTLIFFRSTSISTFTMNDIYDVDFASSIGIVEIDAF